MKPEDQGQEKLQEALASLRHRPPPADLSAKVRDRLQHPNPPPPPTLLQRLGLDIEARPVLVGLSGVAVCLLLVYAVMAARNVKPPPDEPAMAVPRLAGQPMAQGMDRTAPMAGRESGPEKLPRSTDPVLVAPNSSERVPMRTRAPGALQTVPEVRP